MFFDDDNDGIFDAAPLAAFFDTDPRTLDDRPSVYEVGERRRRRQVLKARAARANQPEAGWRCILAAEILSGVMPDWAEDNLAEGFRMARAVDTRKAAEAEEASEP